MQALSSIIVLICYLLFVFIWSGDNFENLLIEMLYVLSVSLDISWFYFGMEEFKLTVLRGITLKLLTIVLIFIFVKSPNDLSGYTLIMAGGSFISSIVLWLPLKNYLMKVKISIKNIKRHVKPNIILFIPVVSLALFHYTDKIMLGAFSTMDELGFYTNSDKIMNLPMGLIYSLGTVMMPRISKLSASNNWVSVKDYLNKSILFSSWMGSAMCFGIMAVSEDFIPFFFGPGYERCTQLLKFFLPAIIIKALSNVFRMQYLIPAGKDKEFNISVICAAIINIVFNAIFIPKLDAVGAVIGTLIAEVVVLALYTYFSIKHISNKVILPSVLFIISGIIMYFLMCWMKNKLDLSSKFLFLISELFCGAAIYCILTGPIIFRLRKRLKK